MNKYQKMILDNTSIKFYSKELDRECSYEIIDDELTLFQDDNYNIVKYNLFIESKSIESIDLFNKKWDKINSYLDQFNIEIDFNNQVRKIRFNFNDNIADSLILNINYVYASRDNYDQVLKEKSEDILVRQASIRVTTGQSLINVLFQPVSSSYAYTKVELYSYMDNVPLLMARYKVSDELFFLPIKDLAYGTYKIKVIEYGINDEVIFTSPYYLVTLQRPRSVQTQNYDR